MNTSVASFSLLGIIGAVLIIALVAIPTLGATKTQIIENRIFTTDNSNSNDTNDCVELDCLNDITLLNLQNGQIIVYNDTTNQFENVDQATFSDSPDATACNNLGAGIIICVGGNIDVKSLIAGAGVAITNSSTTITIANTQPESSTCNNLGSGTIICYGGNLSIKTLKAGTGLSIANTTNDITYTNTGVISNSCSAPISCSGTNPSSITCSTCSTLSTLISSPQNGQQLTYNSTSGKWYNGEESEANVGGGTSVFYTAIGNILEFKTLLSGSGISVTNSSTTVTITNSGVISNSCVKGITCSGTNPSTFNTNFVNGTGISITGSTAQTFSNTGIISNSCSAGITCSGTNPSTFTVTWEKLCQQTIGVGGNSTVTCQGFTARKHLFVTFESFIVTNNIEIGYRFNSDSGTNYSFRESNNGGADTTAVSKTRCNTFADGNTHASGNGDWIILWIDNNQNGERKIVSGMDISGINTSSATAPGRDISACKWDNTSAQITRISFYVVTGTGIYATDSVLTVWGYN